MVRPLMRNGFMLSQNSESRLAAIISIARSERGLDFVGSQVAISEADQVEESVEAELRDGLVR
jgi:hypothetical protein